MEIKHPVSGQTPLEELANSFTHGVGFVLSIAGFVLLLIFATSYDKDYAIFSSLFYGISLMVLYAASTVYHGIQSVRVKSVLQICDHASIYLLIAGSYTPLALLMLGGTWGWTLFGLQWGLAVLGITMKVFYTGRFEAFSLMVYLAMGWLIIFDIGFLFDALPTTGFVFLVVGGLAYSIGVIFYVWDTLPFNHAIWHLFVLTGSSFHFFLMLFYVLD